MAEDRTGISVPVALMVAMLVALSGVVGWFSSSVIGIGTNQAVVMSTLEQTAEQRTIMAELSQLKVDVAAKAANSDLQLRFDLMTQEHLHIWDAIKDIRGTNRELMERIRILEISDGK